MRKVKILLLLMIVCAGGACHATDNTNSENLISILTMSTDDANQNQVTTLLGKPERVEESKKKSKWYYTNGSISLVIYWTNATEKMEKFSFTSLSAKKNVWDNNASKKLRTGRTNVNQAIAILGMPKDMLVKNGTQQMHYNYQSNVLRLFFRNRTLVDYTLY